MRARASRRLVRETGFGAALIMAAHLLLACAAPPAEGREAGCTGATQPDGALADNGESYVPGASWRGASAAAASFDQAHISALSHDLDGGRYGAIHGVVIVRYGHLVYECYAGWSPFETHTMQSVTKSVTSLLFGIAQARFPGAATNLDRPVLDVFSRYAPFANDDSRKRALTLRHLLAMRTAMDFYEQPYAGSPLEQLNQSQGDWVRFIVDRAMIGTPGTAWAYNSGAAILMCGALREITGTAPDVFARQELFQPLGVTSDVWFRSPYDGLPHCGGGLSLTARDLARVGYLVLRQGRWGAQTIVPQEWIAQSTQASSRGSPVYFSDYGSGYGNFWWLFPMTRGGTDLSVMAASGSGGQWLFVVPGLDLVVVLIASDGAGLPLLYDGILPAVVH